MEEATDTVMHNKSVIILTLEEIYIHSDDQLGLRSHSWIWLKLLKDLKAVPSLDGTYLVTYPKIRTSSPNILLYFLFSQRQLRSKSFWGAKDTKLLLYAFISGKLSFPSPVRSQPGVGLVMEDSCKQTC